MTDEILLSIIVPVFNAEKFLESAILSVLNQQADWVELILVDDGSKDGSRIICDRYMCDHVKIVSIENGGAGHARNLGISMAQGYWVMFLDSDDLILSNSLGSDLHNQLCEMRRINIDIIYTCKLECNMTLTDEPRVTRPETLEEIHNYMPAMEFWTCLYRREFLIQKEVRFFEYQKQDIESAFRFRAFSNADGIQVEPSILFYVHRDNPTSNVNTWKMDDLLEIKTKVYFQLFKEFDNQDAGVSAWLYAEAIFNFRQLLMHNRKEGYTPESSQQIQETFGYIRDRQCKIPWLKLPLRYVLISVFLRLMPFKIGFRFIKHYCLIKNREIKQGSVKISLAKDDTNSVLHKLEDYSRRI